MPKSYTMHYYMQLKWSENKNLNVYICNCDPNLFELKLRCKMISWTTIYIK